jgi:hypothetical protein
VPITGSEIAFYRRYDGDLDGLSRSSDRGAAVNEPDWRLLEDLRQRAVIVARGLGSKAYCRELDSLLATHLADTHARAEFQRLVDADLKRIAQSERS